MPESLGACAVVPDVVRCPPGAKCFRPGDELANQISELLVVGVPAGIASHGCHNVVGTLFPIDVELPGRLLIQEHEAGIVDRASRIGEKRRVQCPTQLIDGDEIHPLITHPRWSVRDAIQEPLKTGTHLICRNRGLSAAPRPRNGHACKIEEIGRLGLIQSKCECQRIEDLIGDTPQITPLKLRVVIDAHASKQRNFFATQPGHAPVSPTDEIDLLWRDSGPAGLQELTHFIPVVHTTNDMRGYRPVGWAAGTWVHSDCRNAVTRRRVGNIGQNWPPRKSIPKESRANAMSTWMITGTSSGLGRALANQVLAAGHQVVATARDPQTIRDLQEAHPDAVAVSRLDVTDRASISATLREAEARFGGIDVLVNNAGYGYTSAIEEGENDAVAELFATNFTGPIALIKAVLPSMRERQSGLIVNVSSVGARVTLPGGGFYSAAKAALEGASGALRKEVAPLGIHVMVVEPGSMRTDFRSRSARRSRTRIPDYDEILGRTGEPRLGPQRGDPVKAAQAIVTAAAEAEPPALLLLGSDALVGYRALAEAEQIEVDRHEQLTLSTDATA